MKSIGLLVLAIMLFGCATDASRIDKYRYVAYSWVNGNIDEMIDAWGKPNRDYDKASENKPGLARWAVFSRAGNIEDGPAVRYHCDMTATFGNDGTIIDIRIRHSNSCHRYYKDLDSMLRPGVKPPPEGTT